MAYIAPLDCLFIVRNYSLSCAARSRADFNCLV